MYHYVRPLSTRISIRHNVLDLGLFDQQLEVLAAKYRFVLGNDLLSHDGSDFFDKSNIWLTFDDGYRDCVEYVLPALLKRGATGTVFVPTGAIFERKLLDVTKIHLLLSSVENVSEIISATKQYYLDADIESVIGETFDELYKKFAYVNAYNDADNHFVKNLFQKLAPIDIRKSLLDEVFSQFVERSESSWVDELYMSPDDVSYLVDNGIEIGTHGHTHEWLANLSAEDQVSELTKSIKILDSVTKSNKTRLIGYPFGSYSEVTLNILRNLGIKLGVVHRGARLAYVEPGAADHLELDRIDIMFFDKFINGEFD